MANLKKYVSELLMTNHNFYYKNSCHHVVYMYSQSDRCFLSRIYNLNGKLVRDWRKVELDTIIKNVRIFYKVKL